MISSRKITWTGEKIFVNFQDKNKGSVTIRITGMWIEIIF